METTTNINRISLIRPNVKVLQNNFCDEFWASVEPYSRKIGTEQELFLKELLWECSRDPVIKIPKPGEYVSVNALENCNVWKPNDGNWACINQNIEPDVEYNNEMKKGFSNSLIQVLENPLIHKWLDATIEENAFSEIPTLLDKLKSPNLFSLITNSCEPTNGNMFLDIPFQKELVKYEILSEEEICKNCISGDEILMEIEKCQKELNLINQSNMTQLYKLKMTMLNDVRDRHIKVEND